mmetsp:Transcript_19967/g.47847  ORF Transcript_19967/g.47847 Transcript_19967/m.47847 type:complete len:115 (+) Transcript_19967:241-585(+)
MRNAYECSKVYVLSLMCAYISQQNHTQSSTNVGGRVFLPRMLKCMHSTIQRSVRALQTSQTLYTHTARDSMHARYSTKHRNAKGSSNEDELTLCYLFRACNPAVSPAIIEVISC